MLVVYTLALAALGYNFLSSVDHHLNENPARITTSVVPVPTRIMAFGADSPTVITVVIPVSRSIMATKPRINVIQCWKDASRRLRLRSM